MINASIEFRKRLLENSTLLVKGKLTLADGTTKELSGDDFTSVSFEESTSSSNSFSIGSAIEGSATVGLNNYDERFEEYDFEGAEIILWVGAEMSDGTTEWLRRGTYVVDQPDSYSGVITLDCLDYMSKLEVAYSEVETSYPATLATIAQDICDKCGIVLATPTFTYSDYVVSENLMGTDDTCLDVIGYLAQISAHFAKVNPEGQLCIDWYKVVESETEDKLDGQYFDDANPYASGDTADGGTFDDYSKGYTADGGSFTVLSDTENLYRFSDLTVNTDDVVITGISVTAQATTVDNKRIEGETVLAGKEGYVLSITGNPLIVNGKANGIANRVGLQLVGMTFRPFDGTHVANPCLQAGDKVRLTDRKQNTYDSYATTVNLTVNGSMKVSCSAESASRNSANRAGATTSTVKAARKAMAQELSSRDTLIAQVSKTVADSSGLYSTAVKQDDGSYIYYMHDKPQLKDSKVIYKLTADAVAISTDGGSTYATSISAAGDAVLQRIYAIGINADYVKTGRISGGDSYWNLEDGDMSMQGIFKTKAENETVMSIGSTVKVIDAENLVEYSGAGIEFDLKGDEDTKPAIVSRQEADAFKNVSGMYMTSGTRIAQNPGAYFALTSFTSDEEGTIKVGRGGFQVQQSYGYKDDTYGINTKQVGNCNFEVVENSNGKYATGEFMLSSEGNWVAGMQVYRDDSIGGMISLVGLLSGSGSFRFLKDKSRTVAAHTYVNVSFSISPLAHGSYFIFPNFGWTPSGSTNAVTCHAYNVTTSGFYVSVLNTNDYSISGDINVMAVATTMS